MDPRTPDCKAAYEAWAKKEMPWVLETPKPPANPPALPTRGNPKALLVRALAFKQGEEP